jgi:hypothetical protein
MALATPVYRWSLVPALTCAGFVSGVSASQVPIRRGWRPGAGYTGLMQLHAARLCLDCQEIHTSAACPVCTSESFALLSRWIPAQERRVLPRSSQGSDGVETYRRLLASNETSKPKARWRPRLAIFVAVGLGGWLWRNTSRRGERDRSI